MIGRIRRWLARIFRRTRFQEKVSLPQGLSLEQFNRISQKLRAGAGHFGGHIRVHGSRAAGTAQADSDLDIAILVSADRFETILRERFGDPTPGSAKEKTMLWAREKGKIQAGEAGLRRLRKELEEDLGIEVDISVIRQRGEFDSPPYLDLQP